MKSLIKWTLWQRRKSTIAWSVAVSAFIFINMIFYPTFKDQAAELQKSFESLPEAAVQLFGGSTDFFSPVGFMNSQIFFIMLPLLLGVLGINLGHKLIAQEEQDGTMELLLSRPISRTKLLFAKAIAGTLILTIVTLVSLATTLIVGELVDLDVAAGRTITVTAVCFLMAVSFAALAFMLSAMGKTRSISVAAAAAVAIGGYLVASLSATVSWLETPSKVFPFNYYESEALLRGTAEWVNILYFVGLIAGCGIISWFVFRRRDVG